MEQARGESRAAALQIVTTMLAAAHDAAGNHDARHSPAAPAERPAPRSRKQPTPTPRATRKPAPPAAEATAPPIPEAPAPEAPSPIPSPHPIPSPPAETAREAAAPLPEREALVLSAVRDLARATAAEIAGHCGQPNGSVAVALRGLAARGLVAKAESARGYEYTLASAGVGARRTSAA